MAHPTNIDALAHVVATEAWPAVECAEVLKAFFSHDEWFQVPADTRAALKVMYQAAKDTDSREQLAARAARFLALFDWSEAHLETKDYDAKRLRFFTWGMSHFSANQSVGAEPNNGTWLRFNSKDLFRYVCLLTTSPEDRPRWAGLVSAAVELDDRAAFEQVSQALVERRKVLSEREWTHQTWDSGDEIDGRSFGLVTAGLSVDERMRQATTWHHKKSAVNAAAVWLATQLGCEVPVFAAEHAFPAFHGGSTTEANAWARFLSLVRRHSEALFAELVGAMVESQKFDVNAAEAVFALLSDEQSQVTAADSVKRAYRAGPWVATRTEKQNNRGRLFSKQHPSVAAAAKDYAKKST